MAFAKKAPNRAGQEKRLERILGLSQGYHITLLSVRFQRRPKRRGGTETSDYCRRGDYATHPRTSQERLYFLLEYGFWRRVSVSGMIM